jgi:hypothetical protein
VGAQIKTPLDVTLIVASALDAYSNQHPLLREELEAIQSAGSVPRIRLQFGTGETFVIDITREPKLRGHRDSF